MMRPFWSSVKRGAKPTKGSTPTTSNTDGAASNGNEASSIVSEPEIVMEVIKEGARNIFPLSSQLPFSLPNESDEEEIGIGSTSKIYKSAIKPGHFEYHSYANTNSRQQIIAVKKFESNSIQDFRRETAVLSSIFDSEQRHRNVVIGWGSLVHGEDGHSDTRYMIFLPWADHESLKDFMENREHRNSSDKRQNCIDTMVDVADGLEFLSKITLTRPFLSKYRLTSVMHCDIKPQNILVFRENDKFTFKLSDFGHSYLSWGSTAESTRSKFTYSAPELDPHNPNPIYQDNSDVWSYGCVLLLVLLYTLNGDVQVRRLRKYLSNSEYDTFYDGSKKPFTLKQHALEYIRSLGDIGSLPDPSAKELYLEMGRILKEDILVPDHQARKQIGEVVKKLHVANRPRTLVKLKSFADQVDGKKFDLCAVSARAEYVCLNSNKTGDFSVILANNILSDASIQVLYSIANKSSTPWEQRFPLAASMCASSHIYRVEKLTKKYKIHVFEVQRDPNACIDIEELGSEETTGTFLGKIAISPNGQWIATCTRVGNGHNIQILSREYMKSKSDRGYLDNEPDSSDPPQPQVLDGFQKENIILDMCFTRVNDHFVVVTKYNENLVKFWYYEYKSSEWKLQDYNWKFNKGDFVTRKGLYTTMAPFNNSPGFLATICTSRFVKFSPEEERHINWDDPRFPPSEIEKVFITEDDRFGIILCIEDGLLKVYVTWTKNITKIAKIRLSPDNVLKAYKGYAAGLYDKDGKLSLIIAIPHKSSVFHVDITKAVQRFEQHIHDLGDAINSHEIFEI